MIKCKPAPVTRGFLFVGGWVDLAKMNKCPKCDSSSVASVLFGYPSMYEDLLDDLDSGKVVLGRCVIRPDFKPNRHCNECSYEWETDNLDSGEYVGYDFEKYGIPQKGHSIVEDKEE